MLFEHPEDVVRVARTPGTFCSNTRAKLQSAEAAERRAITNLLISENSNNVKKRV